MDENVYCKCLKAAYVDELGLLDGPHVVQLVTNDKIAIKIEQCAIRTIWVSSRDEINARDLYTVLLNVERLLMISDGRFFNLKELKLSDSSSSSNRLDRFASNLRNLRLSYFKSDKMCRINTCLCLYDAILKAEVYENWVHLLDDLDIALQVYLYSLSEDNMPVDVKCSFAIEQAESMLELVKEYTGLFPSLNPGTRGTSLGMCLDALITKYGMEIFADEIKTDFELFIKTLVNSRVRVMHIKRKQKGYYLNGDESILYLHKIDMLYRYIMLSLLGINESFILKQQDAVKNLDNWNDTRIRFLGKLKNGFKEYYEGTRTC